MREVIIMEKLADMQLNTDKALLGEDVQNKLLSELPQWEICQRDAVRQLIRVFKWRNFAEALAFANEVATLAEANNHHPAVLIEWGKATVSWWTHSLGGLHKNDFIMAARCDSLYTRHIK
jgi:4a-hydroxytetrahydrobiopterin dehydratase